MKCPIAGARGRTALASLAVLWATVIGCDLPRDPNDSLARARRSGLHVGAVVSPPWVLPERPHQTRPGGGIEVELIDAFARSLGADVTWSIGPEQLLAERLRSFELQLVVGGLHEDNPYLKHLGSSRPYGEPLTSRPRVIAVAPGENRLLLALDRFLHAHADAAVRAHLAPGHAHAATRSRGPQ